MAARNVFHRFGDAFAAFCARLRFARDAFTGAMPLPTPYERTFIMTTFSRIAALEAANAALTDRLNTMDEAIAKGVEDAQTSANAAANAAVAGVSARVDAIELDLTTNGPATAPSADTTTETAA